MRRLLPRAFARELRGGKALFLLAVAGVALGVASVLSIQLLNRSALGAFRGTVQALSGDSDLSVLGWAGALDEKLLPGILGTPGVARALPLWRAEVSLERPAGAAAARAAKSAKPADAADGTPGDPTGRAPGLEIVGVDLLSPAGGARALAGEGASGGVAGSASRLAAALGTPGWVALSPAYARELGLAEGEAFDVSLGSRRARLVVGALVDLKALSPLASRRLAVMDIGQAQGLLGSPGRIHQVDVKAAPGTAVPELAERLQAWLGDRGRVATPEQRAVEANGLLAAFRLNLTALSLVSLLVGGFLVYASVRASLARRREELGVLRAVGATRGQVVALVAGEAAVLGLLGTAAGVPLGWLAARFNVDAVSGTIRNLYLLEGIEGLALTPGLVALGVAVGAGGAVAGALWPALDAARTDPRALLSSLAVEERATSGAGRLAALGAGALALAGAAAVVARAWPGAGFVLAIGILAALPASAPAGLVALARLRRPRSLGIAHGVRTLGARLSASAPAAGALAVAVAMLAGVTIMVGSFRATVERWLDATLHADVYVTSPAWRRSRSEALLSPRVVIALREFPAVVAVDFLAQHVATSDGRRVLVSGIDAALPGGERRVALVGATDARTAMQALQGGAALVSEPLARKAGLAPGGTVAIRGAAKEFRLPVAGVYRDYGTEGGAVLVDLSTSARLFGDGLPSNAALYLAPGADAEAAAAALRELLPGATLQVRSNATLRAEVLAIFDQTFAITRLLQVMGLVIAAAGVTLSLLVLARERRAELALYRALGAGRGQLFRVFLGRGLGLGLTGLVLGAAGGAALAAVLLQAVNPAFFGWSLDLYVPWEALGFEAATILAAAVLASLYPAAAASRTPAQELSRDAL